MFQFTQEKPILKMYDYQKPADFSQEEQQINQLIRAERGTKDDAKRKKIEKQSQCE